MELLNESIQVEDDLQLLDLMLKDTNSAPELYQPTNYWSVYAKRFIPELRQLGLHDFRRRKHSVMPSFGASDYSPSFGEIDLFRINFFGVPPFYVLRRIPFWMRFASFLNKRLNEKIPISTPYNLKNSVGIDGLRQLSYEFATLLGDKTGAKPLNQLSASLAGNPEDVFRVNGNVYTISILDYYLRYVYCCRFLNFDSIKVVVELGTGSGKQVEVLRKLHPHLCFYLYDIPPQLYVCHQFLTSVFPESVVGYRETRSMDSLPEPQEGKIFIFGNWQFPLLASNTFDLFWNSSSFQEMEPEVVSNYLSYINNTANDVFLREVMDGKAVASQRGRAGVLKQTTLDHYKSGLSNFELLDMSKAWSPLGKWMSDTDSFWKRIQN